MHVCYEEVMLGATVVQFWMPVMCISSKELLKSHQDRSDEPGALRQARRDQEELADYFEDEITPILTKLLAPGLRDQYARERKESGCWVAFNQPHSGPRAARVRWSQWTPAPSPPGLAEGRGECGSQREAQTVLASPVGMVCQAFSRGGVWGVSKGAWTKLL